VIRLDYSNSPSCHLTTLADILKSSRDYSVVREWSLGIQVFYAQVATGIRAEQCSPNYDSDRAGFKPPLFSLLLLTLDKSYLSALIITFLICIMSLTGKIIIYRVMKR
jgi:hypothetical protein